MSRRMLWVLVSVGLALAALLFVAGAVARCGRPPSTPGSKVSTPGSTQGKRVVHITGRVRLVGSGAFPELLISAEGKHWYVPREDAPKLNHLQQQTVTVEGEETVQELTWANGRSAGQRRYLSNIQLLNVEGGEAP